MNLEESLTIMLAQMMRPNTLYQDHPIGQVNMKRLWNLGRQRTMLKMHTKNKTTTLNTSIPLIIT